MGFVYIIRQGYDNYYKIGATEKDDVDYRLRGLQTGNPKRLYIYSKLETDKCFLLEKELHRRFKDCRVSGEWFLTEKTRIDYFISLYGGQAVKIPCYYKELVNENVSVSVNIMTALLALFVVACILIPISIKWPGVFKEYKTVFGAVSVICLLIEVVYTIGLCKAVVTNTLMTRINLPAWKADKSVYPLWDKAV